MARTRELEGPALVFPEDALELPDPIFEGAALPSAGAVEERLDAWMRGDCEYADVHRWATRLVGRTVFPDFPPADARSAVVELVLQLASDLPLARADIAAMRAFLGGGEAAWTDWYAYVSGRDWAFRRRHGWRPGK